MKLKCIAIFVLLQSITITTHAQHLSSDSIHQKSTSQQQVLQSPNGKANVDTLKKDRSITYFFDLQMGPLIGCNDCAQNKLISFTSSTVGGVKIGKKLQTGLGIGLDSYLNWQVLPVFGNVGWDLFGNKNTNALFIQFNYGWGESWLNNSAREYGYDHTNGGRMIDAQIGYKIRYHDVRIAFSTGIKSQRVYSYYKYPTFIYQPNGIVIQGPPNTKTIMEDMNRVLFSILIGWR